MPYQEKYYVLLHEINKIQKNTDLLKTNISINEFGKCVVSLRLEKDEFIHSIYDCFKSSRNIKEFVTSFDIVFSKRLDELLELKEYSLAVESKLLTEPSNAIMIYNASNLHVKFNSIFDSLKIYGEQLCTKLSAQHAISKIISNDILFASGFKKTKSQASSGKQSVLEKKTNDIRTKRLQRLNSNIIESEGNIKISDNSYLQTLVKNQEDALESIILPKEVEEDIGHKAVPQNTPNDIVSIPQPPLSPPPSVPSPKESPVIFINETIIPLYELEGEENHCLCVVKIFHQSDNEFEESKIFTDNLSCKSNCNVLELNLPTFPDGKQIVSPIIQINATGDYKNINQAWTLAVPHAAPRDNTRQNTLFYLPNEQSAWQPLISSVESNRTDHAEFTNFIPKSVNAEMPCYTCLPIYIAVLSENRQENFIVDKRGLRFVSQADLYFSFDVPPKVIKVKTKYSLEQQVVDPFVLNIVKAKFPKETAYLDSTSSIVSIKSNLVKKLGSGITVTVPITNGQSKKGNTISKNPDTAGQPYVPLSDFQKMFRHQPFMQGLHDHLYTLLWDNAGEKWKLWQDVTYGEERLDDQTTLFLKDTGSYKFVVMRCIREMSTDELVKLWNLVENHIYNRQVELLFFTYPSTDPMKCRLVLSRLNTSCQLIAKITSEGFVKTVIRHPSLVLAEGETISLAFRENLTCMDKDTSELIIQYQQYRSNEISFSVNHIDEKCQKNLDQYRGFVQIFIHSLIMLKKEMVKRKTLQLEIAIFKDKPSQQKTTVILPTVFIFDDKDGLSSKILSTIAIMIQDDWKLVGRYLGFRHTRLQSIERRNMGKGCYAMALDMLSSWVKGTKRSTNRIPLLTKALSECIKPQLIPYFDEVMAELSQKQQVMITGCS